MWCVSAARLSGKAALAAVFLLSYGAIWPERAEAQSVAQSTEQQIQAEPSNWVAWRKMNLAGRQIMLVERMVKMACFAQINTGRTIGRERHLEELRLTKEHYEASEAALWRGSAALGIGAEDNDRVREALAEAERRYEFFAAVLAPAVSGIALSAGSLERLDREARRLEGSLRRVLRLVETLHLRPVAEGGAVAAFTYADAERAGSQRLFKDICLVAAGLNAAGRRVQLRNEISEVESRLTTMIEGAPLIGLPPAQDPRVLEAVQEARGRWLDIQTIVQREIAAGEISPDALGEVADHATPMLTAINRVVLLYEAIN